LHNEVGEAYFCGYIPLFETKVFKGDLTEKYCSQKIGVNYMKRKLISGILITVFAVSLLVTVAPVQAAEKIVVIGTTDSVTKVDPADSYDYFSSNTLVQVTHGLKEFPRDGLDAADGPIVESSSVSTDGMVWTFNLKTGVLFSDGTAFNATAMAWNIDRVLALPDGEPAFILTDVVNKTEVVDESTLKIHLNIADATFGQRLAYTVAWPVSTISLPADELSGRSEATLPAGLGPYMFESWTKDVEMILVPNPNYFGTAPESDKVIIKFYTDASAMLTALENEDIDVAHRTFGPNEMTSIMGNDALEYGTKASAGIRYMLINVDMYDDINVRRAIAAAVNRTEIVEVVFNNFNENLYTMVPSIFSSAKDTFMDGPSQASVAGNMTLSGYNSSNKFPITLWYTPTHYGDTEASVAQLIEAQLEATGFFDVTLDSVEWTQYLDQRKTMGFYLLGWWFDYPDPSNYIDPFVGAGSISFGVNYSSSAMDGYIDTLLTDSSAANRKAATISAQELMATDVPLVPLFTMLSQFGAWQPGVTGFTLEPSENIHYDTVVVGGAGGAPGFELVVALFAAVTIVRFTRRKKRN
jgi:peptide/nickel transport system substrate-binding protein